MVATLPCLVENQTEGALKAVDNPGKLFGIYAIEVGVALEITNSCLERFEFSRHAKIISNKCTKRKR
jgi:hypothetical protein